jgi:DNA repair exonuclease SbcCD ATPase subunit
MSIYESLYHINNPQFSSDRNSEYLAIADGLSELLGKDKRKKVVVITGVIFAPRNGSSTAEIPGRLFLGEQTKTGPTLADIFVCNYLFKTLQTRGIDIVVITNDHESIFREKIEYKSNIYSAAPAKWSIYQHGSNLRFNIRPSVESIPNSLGTGGFVDIIAEVGAGSSGLSLIRDNRTHVHSGQIVSLINEDGISATHTAGCIHWDLTIMRSTFIPMYIQNSQLRFEAANGKLIEPSNIDTKPYEIILYNNGSTDEFIRESVTMLEKKYNFSGIKVLNKSSASSASVSVPVSAIMDMKRNTKNNVSINVGNVGAVNDVEGTGRIGNIGNIEVISTSDEMDKDTYNILKINSAEYQIEKINQYFKDKTNVNADVIDKIIMHHQKYLSELKVPVVTSWRLKSLSWSNMYCYGEDNVIDFLKLKGLVSLIGRNKTGKSSIVDILIYVLFNEVNRGTAADILNKYSNGSGFWVELVFTTWEGDHTDLLSEYMLRIEKGISGNAKGVFLYCDGKLVCNKSADVYKRIEELFGTADMLRDTAISVQDAEQFLDKTSSNQQKILESILGLDKLKELHDEKKRISNGIAAALKQLIEPQPLPSKEELIELDRKKRELEIANNENERIMNTLNIEKNKLVTANDSLFIELKDIEAEIATLALKRLGVEKGMAAIKDDIHSYKLSLGDAGERIRKLREQINNIEKTYPQIWNSNGCSFCRNNHAIINGITRLPDLRRELEALLTPDPKTGKTAGNIEIENKIAKLDAQLSDHQKLSVSLTDKYSNMCQTRDEKYKLIEHNKCEKIATMQKIDKLADLQKAKMSQLIEIGKEIDTKIRQVEILRDQHLKYNEQKAELLKSQEFDLQYSDVLDHKYGIPHLILVEYIKSISRYINMLLASICDFRVEFVFNASSMMINIKQGTETFPASMGSGYQKFVINLIIRIVTANQSHISRPNFLIIDEGFGCLDLINLQSVSKMLDNIKRHFGFILIISHISELQNLSDIKLTIDVKKTYSAIKNSEFVKYNIIQEELVQSIESKIANNMAAVAPASSSCITEVIEGGVAKFHCSICGIKLQKKTGVDTRHLSSKGHQEKEKASNKK